MRVSQEEMDSHHLRIVEGASRLIRKQGIETTSVNDVMSQAGLTHGGFYRHFDSKEALVSAALEEAFNDAIKVIEDSYSDLGPKEGAERYYEHYLSQGHVKHPELGCPISALSMDVARSTPVVKATFSDGFKRAVDKLAEAGNGSPVENRLAAIRRLSMLAGAVMIARASDADTARSVLAACGESGEQM